MVLYSLFGLMQMGNSFYTEAGSPVRFFFKIAKFIILAGLLYVYFTDMSYYSVHTQKVTGYVLVLSGLFAILSDLRPDWSSTVKMFTITAPFAAFGFHYLLDYLYKNESIEG